MKIQYVAVDGKIFYTPQDCEKYEDSLKDAKSKDISFLSGVCHFFDSFGKGIPLTLAVEETNIYGVRIDPGQLALDQITDVLGAFNRCFDNIYSALVGSGFQYNGEVILIYDWTGEGVGWQEIDFEKKEFLDIVNKVIGK